MRAGETCQAGSRSPSFGLEAETFDSAVVPAAKMWPPLHARTAPRRSRAPSWAEPGPFSLKLRAPHSTLSPAIPLTGGKLGSGPEIPISQQCRDRNGRLRRRCYHENTPSPPAPLPGFPDCVRRERGGFSFTLVRGAHGICPENRPHCRLLSPIQRVFMFVSAQSACSLTYDVLSCARMQ